MVGQLLQIIDFIKDADKDRIHPRLIETALLEIQEKIRGKKVVIVSIAGLLRGGKSCLLELLRLELTNPGALRDPRTVIGHNDGIPFKMDEARHTQGILMWNELIPVETDAGTYHVLLVDSQGTFDFESDTKVSAFISTILHLLSSIMLINACGFSAADLDHLTQMQLFSEAVKRDAGECEKSQRPAIFFTFRDRKVSKNSVENLQPGRYGSDPDYFKRMKMNPVNEKKIDEVREAARNMQIFVFPTPDKKLTDASTGDVITIGNPVKPSSGTQARAQEGGEKSQTVEDRVVSEDMKNFMAVVEELTELIKANLQPSYVMGTELNYDNFKEIIRTLVESCKMSGINDHIQDDVKTIMDNAESRACEVGLNAYRENSKSEPEITMRAFKQRWDQAKALAMKAYLQSKHYGNEEKRAENLRIFEQKLEEAAQRRWAAKQIVAVHELKNKHAREYGARVEKQEAPGILSEQIAAEDAKFRQAVAEEIYYEEGTKAPAEVEDVVKQLRTAIEVRYRIGQKNADARRVYEDVPEIARTTAKEYEKAAIEAVKTCKTLPELEKAIWTAARKARNDYAAKVAELKESVHDEKLRSYATDYQRVFFTCLENAQKKAANVCEQDFVSQNQVASTA